MRREVVPLPGIVTAPEPMPTYFVTPAAFMAFHTCGR
jgi:hypothetical protein